ILLELIKDQTLLRLFVDFKQHFQWRFKTCFTEGQTVVSEYYTTFVTMKDVTLTNLSFKCNKPIACPKDWEYHAGKCYLFSTNELNWTDSRDSCIDGGHLLIINSRNEQVLDNTKLDEDIRRICRTRSSRQTKWPLSNANKLFGNRNVAYALVLYIYLRPGYTSLSAFCSCV
uniref:C-type lectin domain-containing protein n=1 Tax=Cyprinus carpio TaxID=7962 RepID=A0A8C2ET57_CYPCA